MEKGTRVRATRQIIESDSEPNPDAGPCEEGWIHATEGDEGEVVFVEDDYLVMDAEEEKMKREEGPAVTVRFDRTGTATLVFPQEIEVI